MYSDHEQYEDEYGHTGDPIQDRLDYATPDQAKKFLQFFQNMINEGNVCELINLYENRFPKLTDWYFKTSPWPEDKDNIAPYGSDYPIMLGKNTDEKIEILNPKVNTGYEFSTLFDNGFQVWTEHSV